MKKRLVPSTRSLAVALGLPVLLLLIPATTRAQANLDLQCTGTTTCLDGGTTLITSTSTPTFNIVKPGGAESGTLFLAVLVPNGTASFSVTVGGTTIAAQESITFTSGKLGGSTNLNEPGLKGFTFSSLASASAQAGVTATSFTVYEYNLGSVTCPGGGGSCVSGISVGSLPVGSVIVAWLENCNGKVIDRTPLGESLTATVVPEQGTLVLLGSGLIVVGGFLRRRLKI